MLRRKEEKMAHSDNLAENVRKDHDETINLITQFQDALLSRKKKDKGAEEIFNNLDKTLMRHFEFEVNYLYPRMKRLILESTQKLCDRQEEITVSIKKSQHVLSKNKINKNRLSTITNTLDMISNHLKDCSDIVSLANYFGKEEKDELNQRFKEFCGLNGSLEERSRRR